MKSFSVIDTYVKNHNDVVNNIEKIDEEKYSILESYCDIIDDIMRLYGTGAMEVNIVSEYKFVLITIEVSTFSASKTDQSYFDLIERSICFATRSTPEQTLQIDFMFPSVFEG